MDRQTIITIVIGCVALVALGLGGYALYKEEKYMPTNSPMMHHKMPPGHMPPGRHPMGGGSNIGGNAGGSTDLNGPHRCAKWCTGNACDGKGQMCQTQCMNSCLGYGSQGTST